MCANNDKATSGLPVLMALTAVILTITELNCTVLKYN